MTFEKCVEHTLGIEGGYVDNPNDRGGETKFGISKRSYPNIDIKNLTLDQARAIYKRDYWYAAQCDKLPELIRLAHFDCAVNCGVGTAVRILQEAARVDIDGKLGVNTLYAVDHMDQRKLLEDMLWLRVRHHARDSRDHPRQREFLPGWLLRVIRVRKDS